MSFFDFWTESIAIDLGTANTLIIHNDKVVVDSPSIVAIDQKSGKIIAVGKEAKLMHGKTSKIISKKTGILKNLPKTFDATRYHSLIIDKKTLSKDLEITAETKDGLIMGVKHKKYNVHGVQFHPESIKTKLGLKILKNFIKFKN